MKAVGLDLDGTLLDTAARHKAALADAARALGISLPSRFSEVFYEAKRQGDSGRQVLARHQISRAAELARVWAETVEQENFLAIDTLYPSVTEQLRRMRGCGFVFYIATARQHPDRVRRQTRSLGLEQLVSAVLVAQLGPDGKPLRTKAELTMELGLGSVVGDSEVDQEWAQQLEATFLPVSCGIRSSGYWRKRGLNAFDDAVAALEHLRRLETERPKSATV